MPVQRNFDPVEIGTRLAQVRQDLGLSQSEMAERLDISLRAYQSYERAERELPFSVATRLYLSFDVNPVWLALGTDAAPPKAQTFEQLTRLCADLYERWETTLGTSAPNLPVELKVTLHRRLARIAFREGAVPEQEIDESIGDLQPGWAAVKSDVALRPASMSSP